MQFKNVTAEAEANVYFNGKVVSHSLFAEDGSKTTLGVIFPGEFHFGTEKPEIMDITAGSCEVTIDGTTEAVSYGAGERFEVAGDSGFTISVKDEICQYVCRFVD